ncbi:hypothetical protein D3C75_487120 [compost metagenome]
MREIPDTTNQELNMELALLMGFTKDKHYPGRVTRGGAVTMPKNYCTDPAASLEVQAVAIEADFEGYVYNLNEIKYRGYEAMTFKVISEMLTATPRERAMAAWLTLQSARSSHREELLERLSRYKTVPGHGPDLDKLPDDELERRLNLIESAFEYAFKEEGD